MSGNVRRIVAELKAIGLKDHAVAVPDINLSSMS